MTNKLVISSGHAKYVAGTSGYIDEVTEARKVVNQVVTYLKQLNCQVYMFHDDTSRTQRDNIHTIINYHNSKTRDLDVSIHFNALEETNNPVGVEVLYYSEKKLAGEVSASIAVASGLKDRGAKQRIDLGFLKGTTKPSILIEVCFVDSQADVQAYQKNFDAICRAIAEMISGKKLTTSTTQYHIVVTGDTVSRLAKQYGTTLAKIKNWNKLDDEYLIQIGQKLRVK